MFAQGQLTTMVSVGEKDTGPGFIDKHGYWITENFLCQNEDKENRSPSLENCTNCL